MSNEVTCKVIQLKFQMIFHLIISTDASSIFILLLILMVSLTQESYKIYEDNNKDINYSGFRRYFASTVLHISDQYSFSIHLGKIGYSYFWVFLLL